MLPYFMLMGFVVVGFWFAFYSKVMITWTFFFLLQSKLGQEQIGTDGSVCLVEGRASWAVCLAVGGAPAHVTACCPPGKSGLVPQ